MKWVPPSLNALTTTGRGVCLVFFNRLLGGADCGNMGTEAHPGCLEELALICLEKHRAWRQGENCLNTFEGCHLGEGLIYPGLLQWLNGLQVQEWRGGQADLFIRADLQSPSEVLRFAWPGGEEGPCPQRNAGRGGGRVQFGCRRSFGSFKSKTFLMVGVPGSEDIFRNCSVNYVDLLRR